MLFIQIISAILLLFDAQNALPFQLYTEGVVTRLNKSTLPSDTSTIDFNLINDDEDEERFEKKLADFNEFDSLCHAYTTSTNTFISRLDIALLEPCFFTYHNPKKRLFLLYHQLKIDC